MKSTDVIKLASDLQAKSIRERDLRKKEFSTCAHILNLLKRFSTLEKILSEVKYADRATALTQKQKAQKILLPFVTQFQPSLPGLKNILMEKWHLIENQPPTQRDIQGTSLDLL